VTSTGVIGQTNRTAMNPMASSQGYTDSDSDSATWESIQDCFIRSEKVGRLTDNQSISNLKVNELNTCQVSKSVLTQKK
jgi:hypothetical protein